MPFLHVSFDDRETIFQGFTGIAQKISTSILKINRAHYRIVDFEFYAFAKVLPDPHTYKNDLQLQNGKFYLHASGVDITFGDGINHGGILLRSVVKVSDGATEEVDFKKKQFEGPQNVATELFSNLNSLGSNEKNELSLVDIVNQGNEEIFVIKTKRVGLTPKNSDQDDYYRNLAIRYIVVLPTDSGFKQTIKGIERLLEEEVAQGKISIAGATKILGYKKRFA